MKSLGHFCSFSRDHGPRSIVCSSPLQKSGRCELPMDLTINEKCTYLVCGLRKRQVTTMRNPKSVQQSVPLEQNFAGQPAAFKQSCPLAWIAQEFFSEFSEFGILQSRKILKSYPGQDFTLVQRRSLKCKILFWGDTRE